MEDLCLICMRPATDTHHMIHGTANRKLADEDGLTCRLCHECHMNLHSTGVHDGELKVEAERMWLKNTGKTIEDFIKRYGRNYL